MSDEVFEGGKVFLIIIIFQGSDYKAVHGGGEGCLQCFGSESRR